MELINSKSGEKSKKKTNKQTKKTENEHICKNFVLHI